MSSFILPWGHTNEKVEYLEDELLSRGVVTENQLKKIYKSCLFPSSGVARHCLAR